MTPQPPLLELRSLSRHFVQGGGLMGEHKIFKAVDNVSLILEENRTLGLVGESGSGKSTLAKMAVHLLAPSQGNVLLEGRPIYNEGGQKADSKLIRALPSHLQMVFQDPYSSLNPRLKIGYSISEPLICSGLPRAESRKRVADLLASVGLSPKDAARYPHEFSGGQRQRIALARALAPSPKLIVCDEPVSSLDASVQAQVLNLLKDSQEAMRLAYLFISHDLSVVSHMSDRVAVMYMGRVVEEGDTGDIFTSPLHPYTALLLEASTRKKKGGRAPSRAEPAGAKAGNAAENRIETGAAAHLPGCAFAPRCPKKQPDCLQRAPNLEIKEKRRVACFHPGAE